MTERKLSRAREEALGTLRMIEPATTTALAAALYGSSNATRKRWAQNSVDALVDMGLVTVEESGWRDLRGRVVPTYRTVAE